MEEYNMELGLLVTMATVGFAGTVLEKTLSKTGKIDDSQFISLTSTTMIASATVGCVIKLINQVKQLA